MNIKIPYYKKIIPVKNGKGAKKSQLSPIIKIRIFNKEKYVDVLALIDSGADYCLFPAQIGEIIGLRNIKGGHKVDFYGLSGRPISFYSNNIEIKVGGYKFPCEGYFSYKFKGSPLLGENGFQRF